MRTEPFVPSTIIQSDTGMFADVTVSAGTPPTL
ncbi:unannotated protein [freshwater metagenome]|uniref:Unannotated protein n=1 Tax=freshwater metagenome TaxID=449393 RepID=A0A6J7UH54_9ZZZZ